MSDTDATRPDAAPARRCAVRRSTDAAVRRAAAGLAAATLGLGLALGGPSASASALGPLTAQSLRGEPLRAVVELPDADGAAVRIAAPATYARFGLIRDGSLARATLRTVVERDGKRFLRIESEDPVDAGELVLLLEAGGGLRRAYRLRLDSAEPADRVNVRGVEPIARLGGSAPIADARPAEPPGARPGAAPERGTAVRSAGTAPDAARADATVSEPARAASTSPDPASPPDAPGAVRDASPAVPIAPPARPVAIDVAPGDTLDALARALRPPGATVEQSALALWRANPRGFSGRPPRPVAGMRLVVPGEADVLAIDSSEARGWASTAAADAPSDVAKASGAPSAAPGSNASAGSAPSAGSGAATAVQPRPPARLAVAASATASASTPASPAPRRAPVSSTSPQASSPQPPSSSSTLDAEIADTLRRARELERRVAALKAGFEANARREEATMRALIDATRGAGDGGRTPPR